MPDKPILLGFSPALGLPDPSPFTMKVYLFLKANQIDFELQPGDVRKTPYNKIPVLEHAGQVIADSELIIDYLAKMFEVEEPPLEAQQHAYGKLLASALDDKLYWSIVYARWMVDENAAVIRDAIFADVPSLVRKPLFAFIRRSVRRDLHGQGIGRLPESLIYDFARRELAALSDALGDNTFLFGDAITRYDCALAAYVAQMLPEGLDSPHARFLESHPNLVDYWQRIRADYVDS